MNDELNQHCSVYFRFEGCEQDSIIKDVKLPWDAPWSRVLYEVALALEGYGYIDVVNRIQVKDVGGEFIPLKEDVDASFYR